MMTPEPRLSPATSGSAGDMRGKLLEAAIDVFARHGFAGATTRMLAAAAGANQQAIPYYFGGKEGLYLATADHIGERIRHHVGPVAMRIRARLAAPVEASEAGVLLGDLLKTAARLMVSAESAAWARFLISEQMEPSEAFERIYTKVMSPLLETARSLVGLLLGEDPSSETVRLRTLSMLGQVLVLRVAHAAVTRQLGWHEIGEREFALIAAMIDQTIAALLALRRSVSP